MPELVESQLLLQNIEWSLCSSVKHLTAVTLESANKMSTQKKPKWVCLTLDSENSNKCWWWFTNGVWSTMRPGLWIIKVGGHALYDLTIDLFHIQNWQVIFAEQRPPWPLSFHKGQCEGGLMVLLIDDSLVDNSDVRDCPPLSPGNNFQNSSQQNSDLLKSLFPN